MQASDSLALDQTRLWGWDLGSGLREVPRSLDPGNWNHYHSGMEENEMNQALKKLVVELDPQVHRELRIQALQEGRNLRSLLTDCFRCYKEQLNHAFTVQEPPIDVE